MRIRFLIRVLTVSLLVVTVVRAHDLRLVTVDHVNIIVDRGRWQSAFLVKFSGGEAGCSICLSEVTCRLIDGALIKSECCSVRELADFVQKLEGKEFDQLVECLTTLKIKGDHPIAHAVACVRAARTMDLIRAYFAKIKADGGSALKFRSYCERNLFSKTLYEGDLGLLTSFYAYVCMDEPMVMSCDNIIGRYISVVDLAEHCYRPTFFQELGVPQCQIDLLDGVARYSFRPTEQKIEYLRAAIRNNVVPCIRAFGDDLAKERGTDAVKAWRADARQLLFPVLERKQYGALAALMHIFKFHPNGEISEGGVSLVWYAALNADYDALRILVNHGVDCHQQFGRSLSVDPFAVDSVPDSSENLLQFVARMAGLDQKGTRRHTTDGTSCLPADMRRCILYDDIYRLLADADRAKNRLRAPIAHGRVYARVVDSTSCMCGLGRK